MEILVQKSKRCILSGEGVVACDLFLIGGVSYMWHFVTWGVNLFQRSVTYFLNGPYSYQITFKAMIYGTYFARDHTLLTNTTPCLSLLSSRRPLLHIRCYSLRLWYSSAMLIRQEAPRPKLRLRPSRKLVSRSLEKSREVSSSFETDFNIRRQNKMISFLNKLYSCGNQKCSLIAVAAYCVL